MGVEVRVGGDEVRSRQHFATKSGEDVFGSTNATAWKTISLVSAYQKADLEHRMTSQPLALSQQE